MKKPFSNARINFFIILFLNLSGLSFSQSVSVNTTGAPPNQSAGLDINIPDKGFLVPRLSLNGTVNSSPLSAHIAGIIIYNTATTGDVTPGLYYNDGAKWVRINQNGTTTGNMLYWSGTGWTLLPPGLPGQKLQLNSSNIPAWQ